MLFELRLILFLGVGDSMDILVYLLIFNERDFIFIWRKIFCVFKALDSI